MEVRNQGAQIDGAHAGSQTVFTVDSSGAVVATNTVAINAASSPTRSVSSVAATNITVSGLGFSNAADDDRITIASPLPTIFNDSIGNETKTNPLVADINGLVECWIIGGMYDLLVTALGVRTLYTDVATVGGESLRSNIYGGAGFQNGWNFDTLRTLDSGDALVRFAEAGTERFRIKAGGGFTSGSSASSLISGPVTIDGLITATVGLAGPVNTTGDFDGRRIIMNNGTTLVAGTHFAFSAGWGDTAALVLNDPGNEYDTRGMFAITCNGSGIAANPTVTLTYADGAYPDKTRVVCCRTNSVAPTTAFWIVSADASAVIFVFVGTPVAGTEYGCSWMMVG